ncbi:hypothetical protein NQ318_007281, partial [Aromia moschata]
QTVNQHYYIEVLTTHHERVRRRRPDLWKTKSWKIRQDNVPAHSVLSVKAFIAKDGITIQIGAEGDKIRKYGAVKAKATEVLNQLTEEDSSTAFKNKKIVWT